MEGVFSVKIVAFLFALIGAALNMFMSVIRTPVPGSTFTGSMYDAVRSVMTNGLPDEGGTVLAILILGVLFLVPVIAAVSGLFIPFSKSKRSGIILCLCALVNGLAAWGIYYLSSEIFESTFLTNYIAPYAQKVSFITPAIWAVCYLVAGVLVLKQLPPEGGTDLSKPIYGPSIVFGIGWTEKEGAADCDLDACAFLFSGDKVFISHDKGDKGMVFYGHKVLYNEEKHKAMWLTNDATEGNIKKKGSGQNDLEQIIVQLNEVPSEISMIVFVVTVGNSGTFGHPLSAHARLVDEVEVTEKHIEDRTLKVDTMAGRKLKLRTSLKDKELADKNGLIVAEIHRMPEGGWGWNEKGNVKDDATSDGLRAFCEKYGIKLS